MYSSHAAIQQIPTVNTLPTASEQARSPPTRRSFQERRIGALRTLMIAVLLRPCSGAFFERSPLVVPRWNWFGEIVPDVAARGKGWSPRRQRVANIVRQRFSAAIPKLVAEGATSLGVLPPRF
jgi:hypothetical protein